VARAEESVVVVASSLGGGRAALPSEGEPFFKTKINLWMIQLCLVRGERAAAAEILAQVKGNLAQSEHEGYKRRAEAIAL
jgi:hypothetical protein